MSQIRSNETKKLLNLLLAIIRAYPFLDNFEYCTLYRHISYDCTWHASQRRKNMNIHGPKNNLPVAVLSNFPSTWKRLPSFMDKAEVSVPTWRGRVNLSDLMVFMIFMEHTQALPLRQASALSYPCRCDIKRKENHQNLRTVRVRVEPWATCCALPKPAYFYRTKKVWALYGITDIPNEACGYLSQTKRLGLQICSMGGRCLTAWSWDKPMWFVWQN